MDKSRTRGESQGPFKDLLHSRTLPGLLLKFRDFLFYIVNMKKGKHYHTFFIYSVTGFSLRNSVLSVV